MSPAKQDQRFRLRASVIRREGRWYVTVVVTGIRGTRLPPSEYLGPDGGLATEQEALVYYIERVKPALKEIGERAEQAGGSFEKIFEPTLH